MGRQTQLQGVSELVAVGGVSVAGGGTVFQGIVHMLMYNVSVRISA